ncbi:MAG: hypothetical protein U0325_21805 [Polyangiales bacterium]
MWPLGLLAFRLLTGKHYWRSANGVAVIPVKEVLIELLTKPLDPASARAAALGATAPPPGFDAWFARALERDPASRFANATEAFDALLPVLTGRVPAAEESLDLEKYPSLAEPEETRVAVRAPAASAAAMRPRVKTPAPVDPPPEPAAPAAAPPAPARSRELYVAVAGVVVLAGVVVALLLTR